MFLFSSSCHNHTGDFLSSLRNITLHQTPIQVEKLTWFRFGQLGDHVILTTDTGDWHLLEPDAFSDFIAGELPEDSEDYAGLLAKGFVRNGFDVELQGGLIRRTKSFLYAGVHHHRVHLSTPTGALPVEQAKAIVDHIFTSQSDSLTIAMIQGPKPVDPNVISFVQEFAEEKNKYERRNILYQLHGSLDGLDESTIGMLAKKRIQLHPHFDGSATVHDAQRNAHGGTSHEHAQARLLQVHAATEDADTVAHVHVGRAAQGQAAAIVAGLAEAHILGFRVTPILEGDHAITPQAYGEFIVAILGCLASQEEGTPRLREVQVDSLKARIWSGAITEPLMCTPPSTGYNARSYDPDGNVFPSCSALQLHALGDSTFLIGNVANDSQEEIGNHPTLRTLMVATVKDCLPGYHQLWSTPYIGVDPIAAYRSSGNIFTTTTNSVQHQATQAMLEAVFLHVIEELGSAEE